MSSYRQRSNCRLCNSEALTTVLTLQPTPPANAFIPKSDLAKEQQCYPLTIRFCEECGHVQLADVVPPQELFEHYVYVSGTSPVFVEHFRKYAEFCIEKFALPKNSRVLDIGSNDGTLLRFFKEKDFAILGVDPAREIAAQATADGIPTENIFFTPETADSLKKQHGTFDLICANNVFAHTDDLQGFTAGIKKLLSDDGAFVFEVSYLLDVFEKTLFDTIYHEHLAYHSVKPLAAFFRNHGLELTEVLRVPTHGGSLRGVVRHQGKPISASVQELIQQEAEAGLHSAQTFRLFAEKIRQHGEALKEKLYTLKQQGKRIAAYGAPAKATTLMYHFGLTPQLIEFIVDDSPLKQGLYSPGMHIPVITSEEMYSNMPDCLLILAWNFAKPIIKNNQQFLEKGGCFIVPLPELEIHHE